MVGQDDRQSDIRRGLWIEVGAEQRVLVVEKVVHHGEQREMPTFLPSLALSTDNAAMIAAAGLRKFRAGMLAPPDLNADPALAL